MWLLHRPTASPGWTVPDGNTRTGTVGAAAASKARWDSHVAGHDSFFHCLTRPFWRPLDAEMRIIDSQVMIGSSLSLPVLHTVDTQWTHTVTALFKKLIFFFFHSISRLFFYSGWETQYGHLSRADTLLFLYQELRLLLDTDDPCRSVNYQRDITNGSRNKLPHLNRLSERVVQNVGTKLVDTRHQLWSSQSTQDH